MAAVTEPLPISQELAAQLRSSPGVVELCDDAGAVVGFFLQPRQYETFVHGQAQSLFPQELIAERLAEPSGGSLGQILAELAQR